METGSPTALPKARMAGIAIVSVVAGIVLLPVSQIDYLLFHSLVETFSVVVAVGIFIISWNTRAISGTRYLPVLGTGLFFAGVTGVLHMLAYKGMGVFPGMDVDLATQLWIISRFFIAGAFVLAGLSLEHRIDAAWTLVGFAAVWVLAMFSLFAWHVVPPMLIAGRGLTVFKIGSEYIVVAALAFAAWLLLREGRPFEPWVTRLLLASIVSAAAAELAFTLYVDVYGITNTIGHYLALLSSVLIYVALIDAALTRPYGVLFHELNDREQAERRIADVLQSTLLTTPERIDAVTLGFAHQSATSGALVGGDFYDLFSPASGRVAFIVGDVCGKGVEAAATTAMIRTVIRSFAYESPEPARVLQRASEVVERELPDDKFVTVLFGVIDLATGETLLGSAGHPGPVLRSGGVTSELTLPRNPPLGVLLDQRFETSRTVLREGDLLVMFTDGLLDAGWPRGGFGARRIVAAVQGGSLDPSKATSALLRTATAYAGGVLTDDVEVVALRYGPVSEPLRPGAAPSGPVARAEATV